MSTDGQAADTAFADSFGPIVLRNVGAAMLMFSGVLTAGSTVVALGLMAAYIGATFGSAAHAVGFQEALGSIVLYAPLIGRGRLIADLPLTEFIHSFELDAVLTRTADADGLARAMAEAGGTVLEREAELVVVRGLSQRRIAEIALDHRILVYELIARTSTLEAAYLRASAEQTDYDAGQVVGDMVTA
ncbi:hypothetical protein [Streptomyces sp. NPDC058874]|uniref:hypothetical protein n=1 Tax=unclassified Streptomyces TaxID=2593676 RepID=UPI0036BFAC01